MNAPTTTSTDPGQTSSPNEPIPLTDEAEEIQSDLPELQRYADTLRSALSDAESSECLQDLAANLAAAQEALIAIKADLSRLAKAAAKMVKNAQK